MRKPPLFPNWGSHFYRAPGGSLYPITNGSSTLAIRHCNFCDGLITTTKTRAGKNYSRRRSKSFLVHPPKDILPTGYAIILIKGLCQTYKDPNKAMVVTMLSEFTYGLACYPTKMAAVPPY